MEQIKIAKLLDRSANVLLAALRCVEEGYLSTYDRFFDARFVFSEIGISFSMSVDDRHISDCKSFSLSCCGITRQYTVGQFVLPEGDSLDAQV